MYRAVYNATKTGNYSLEVIDVSDGEHAVGSPFEVLVEAAQAHAPATLVWWDRQVRDVEVRVSLKPLYRRPHCSHLRLSVVGNFLDIKVALCVSKQAFQTAGTPSINNISHPYHR